MDLKWKFGAGPEIVIALTSVKLPIEIETARSKPCSCRVIDALTVLPLKKNNSLKEYRQKKAPISCCQQLMAAIKYFLNNILDLDESGDVHRRTNAVGA